MYRVKSLSLKTKLKEKAAEVKDHLIAAVDTWCREKIIFINQTY